MYLQFGRPSNWIFWHHFLLPKLPKIICATIFGLFDNFFINHWDMLNPKHLWFLMGVKICNFWKKNDDDFVLYPSPCLLAGSQLLFKIAARNLILIFFMCVELEKLYFKDHVDERTLENWVTVVDLTLIHVICGRNCSLLRFGFLSFL